MRQIFPNNIFSTLFILSIDEENKKGIEIKDSSLIIEEISADQNAIGLIPSLDLINHRDLFVSKKLGVSLNGLLSNSYVYFNSENAEINKLNLQGDISTNEVILSKIIFQERYNTVPEITLDSNEKLSDAKNYLISGNNNWKDNIFRKGTSFSEQVADMIEFPYVNFIFASQEKSIIEEFNSRFEKVGKKILSNAEENLNKIGLDESVNEFIIKNLDGVKFDFTEYDNTAFSEILKLAYYHQILDDLFDIKFV